MARKKNIDVMWKKEYWERVLEPMPPKKRIQVERWFTFERFVVTIRPYKKDREYEVFQLIESGRYVVNEHNFKFVKELRSSSEN